MDVVTSAIFIFIFIVLELVFVPMFVYTERTEAPKNTWLPSPGAFAAGIGLASVIAYFIGVDVGIRVECSKEDAGNLCGLAGYFLFGPRFALIAAIIAPLVIAIAGKLISRTDRPHQPTD